MANLKDLNNKTLEERIKALKRFVNKNPESKYINNGFYTNKYVYINDKELAFIPNEFKPLGNDYVKLLNVKELEDKFLKDFKGRKAMKAVFNRSEFNKLNTELKRFKFQQIKIRNGSFALYDEFGDTKWFMKGKTEALKGFNLDFDYKLLIDIFNYIESVKPAEVVFYSDKTFLKVRVTGRLDIYARGVILKEQPLEQKTLV